MSSGPACFEACLLAARAQSYQTSSPPIRELDIKVYRKLRKVCQGDKTRREYKGTMTGLIMFSAAVCDRAVGPAASRVSRFFPIASLALASARREAGWTRTGTGMRS